MFLLFYAFRLIKTWYFWWQRLRGRDKRSYVKNGVDCLIKGTKRCCDKLFQNLALINSNTPRKEPLNHIQRTIVLFAILIFPHCILYKIPEYFWQNCLVLLERTVAQQLGQGSEQFLVLL